MTNLLDMNAHQYVERLVTEWLDADGLKAEADKNHRRDTNNEDVPETKEVKQ